MINPDGVVFGNYRTSFLGKDMNRMFGSQINDPNNAEIQDIKLDERLIPEITAVRNFMKCHKEKIVAFFDIHQHSKRKSIFLYGP